MKLVGFLFVIEFDLLAFTFFSILFSIGKFILGVFMSSRLRSMWVCAASFRPIERVIYGRTMPSKTFYSFIHINLFNFNSSFVLGWLQLTILVHTYIIRLCTYNLIIYSKSYLHFVIALKCNNFYSNVLKYQFQPHSQILITMICSQKIVRELPFAILS